ncbi:hypothetical protein MKEN_01157700 [Mycena kentingensis (nom. inval.)]|nr:hypothetical protein MKEN_01157700 [Mycena kentingensis (nom. inval.)]
MAEAFVVAREHEATQWLSSEDISFFTNETDIIKRTGSEQIQCYNMGTKADRAPIISVIDDFCAKNMGHTVINGQVISTRYNYGTFTVLVSGAAINGCNFVVDGNCGRLLRLPVDSCNTGGVNGKQVKLD